MKFLKKLQEKPEYVKKRIFWAALIVSVGIIGFFWIKSLSHSLEKLKVEGQKVGQDSQETFQEIKEESGLSEVKEGLEGFKKFLESEDFKKLFENNLENTE